MSASVIRYLPCSICDACRSQRRYPNMPGIQRTCEIQYLQWLQCSMVSTNSIGFPWFLCKLLGVQVKRIGFIKFTNFTKAQPKLTQDLWVQYHLHSENTVEVGKQLPNQALRVVWEWSESGLISFDHTQPWHETLSCAFHVCLPQYVKWFCQRHRIMMFAHPFQVFSMNHPLTIAHPAEPISTQPMMYMYIATPYVAITIQ